MTSNDLKEVLREVKLVRKKMERLEELVEERLVGSEQPLDDEVEAIKEYTEAKKKKKIELLPLNATKKGA